MPEQTTNRVLMIRPAAFGFNPETAKSNSFQQNREILGATSRAVDEFDGFVSALRDVGIQVEVAQDIAEPPKPDAVFPNNWVSFHEGSRAVLYPMANPSRQAEVRPEIVAQLGYEVALDLRSGAEGRALEGTGSMVLDRANNVGYACLSPRTDCNLLAEFSKAMGISIIPFYASYQGEEIYHTNVVMSVGEENVVVCLEIVTDPETLSQQLNNSGKTILEISASQMANFAGNLLLLKGSSGPVWAMSQTARNAFDSGQLKRLESEAQIVSANISTIETLGGGSARCMIAELF